MDATSLVGRYFAISLLATLVMLGSLLPTFPKTLTGWLCLLGLSAPFAFSVGIAGDVILHYRPSNKCLQFGAVLCACVAVVLLTAGFLYIVGVVP